MTTDPDQLRRELLALGAEGGITGGDELAREIEAASREALRFTPLGGHAVIPGSDPGACPDCGGWRQAGIVHDCEQERARQAETMERLRGLTREALGPDGPIEARRVDDVIEVRWEPDTEAHRRLLATARGYGVLSAERLEAGIETLPSWVDPATGVRHYSVVLDATTVAWEGVDRPPGVPACADAIYDSARRELSWHWVEATLRVVDDGEGPARARELDAEYGPCWRCEGMGQ